MAQNNQDSILTEDMPYRSFGQSRAEYDAKMNNTRADFPNELNSIPIPMRPQGDTSVQAGVGQAIGAVVGQNNGLPPVNLSKPAYEQGSLEGGPDLSNQQAQQPIQNPTLGQMSLMSQRSGGGGGGYKYNDPSVSTTQMEDYNQKNADFEKAQQIKTNEAMTAEATEKQKVNEQAIEDQNRYVQTLKDVTNDFQKKYDALPKVDPRRVWNNSSNWGKATMLLGMLSDAAYAEVRDPAQSFTARLDKLISEDIAQQNKDYDNKKEQIKSWHNDVMKVADTQSDADKFKRLSMLDSISTLAKMKLAVTDPESKSGLSLAKGLSEIENYKNKIAQDMAKEKADNQFKNASLALQRDKLNLDKAELGLKAMAQKQGEQKLSVEKARMVGLADSAEKGIENLTDLHKELGGGSLKLLPQLISENKSKFNQALTQTQSVIGYMLSGANVAETERQAFNELLSPKWFESNDQYKDRLKQTFDLVKGVSDPALFGEAYKKAKTLIGE